MEDEYITTKKTGRQRRSTRPYFTESYGDYCKRLVQVPVKAIDAGEAFVKLVVDKAALDGHKPTEILASEIVQWDDWPPVAFAPVDCEEIIERWGNKENAVRNGCLSSLWSTALSEVRRRHCIRQ